MEYGAIRESIKFGHHKVSDLLYIFLFLKDRKKQFSKWLIILDSINLEEKDMFKKKISTIYNKKKS